MLLCVLYEQTVCAVLCGACGMWVYFVCNFVISCKWFIWVGTMLLLLRLMCAELFGLLTTSETRVNEWMYETTRQLPPVVDCFSVTCSLCIWHNVQQNLTWRNEIWNADDRIFSHFLSLLVSLSPLLFCCFCFSRHFLCRQSSGLCVVQTVLHYTSTHTYICSFACLQCNNENCYCSNTTFIYEKVITRNWTNKRT